jgi:hypothetical protein
MGGSFSEAQYRLRVGSQARLFKIKRKEKNVHNNVMWYKGLGTNATTKRKGANKWL